MIPESSFDDPRDVLKSALGEIERHHKVRRGGRKTGERIRGPETENLAPHQQFNELFGAIVSQKSIPPRSGTL
jgi:hypothetical protein